MQERLTAALSIRNLVKRFGDFTAVNGISLEIEPGCVFGILGPNGAGKSTSIKMITGLMRPDSGSIQVFGRDLDCGGAILDIGLCPQELVIWEGLTLMEQLLFMARMYNIPSSEGMRRAMRLLDAMCLTDKKDQRASTLSGGMKRRLNILLALMHDPKILILDEPQAGLDPQSRVLVRDYIKSISRGKTIVITTHDMEEADKIADRVAIIDRGSILVEDSPEHLKKTAIAGEVVEISLSLDSDKHMTPEMENEIRRKHPSWSLQGSTLKAVSDSPLELAGEMEAVLKAAGIRMEDMKIRKGTLEDVFISLTGRGLRE